MSYFLRGFFLENLFQINSIKTRVNHGGNFCSHDKLNPCLALTIQTDNKPPFLYSVGEAFRRYFFFPDLFPTLNHAASSRQQRSERREAVVITMLALLEFLELASLRVGIPTERGFQPLTLDVLRKRTNLHPRRFERAIQSLRAAGILKVADQYKYRHPLTKRYHFFPAVRSISKAFFEVLGFGNSLVEERLAASKRIQRKAAKVGKKVSQFVKYSLENVATAYNEWREKRQEAINAKLTRGQGSEIQRTAALIMEIEGISYEEARREVLKSKAKLERQRRRQIKEDQKRLQQILQGMK